jgi:anti-sigma-K factor RskA
MLRGLSAALSAVVAIALAAASSFAATETPLTIEQLLAQGWEIAGYASDYDEG